MAPQGLVIPTNMQDKKVELNPNVLRHLRRIVDHSGGNKKKFKPL